VKYLIDGAGSWWRMWSVRLAAFAGVLAAYLAENPDDTEALLALLPDGPLRVLASVGIGLLVFGVPAATRLAKQPTKENDDA